MEKIGLIINPIAGMGGRVGLKGTDGKDILEKARSLGAEPEATTKAAHMLQHLTVLSKSVKFLTGEGAMGADVLTEHGFDFEVIHAVSGESSQEDTLSLVKALEEAKVELILFVGGDGTARDVHDALTENIPVIGVPAGVKIYSAVHGNSPESAGRLAANVITEKVTTFTQAEVIDLDEAGFRNDEVDISVFGYLTVPVDETHMQNLKSPSPQSDADAQESIALDVIDSLEEDTLYIVGSGTTPSEILVQLDQPVTILGVDLLQNKKTIATDVNEQEIMDHLENLPDGTNVKLIVTTMGGQGYVLGRGNQQLSEKVLSYLDKDDIIIVATPNKLHTLGNRDMLIYTLDAEVNQKFSGYYKVTTGYGQKTMHKLSSKQ